MSDESSLEESTEYLSMGHSEEYLSVDFIETIIEKGELCVCGRAIGCSNVVCECCDTLKCIFCFAIAKEIDICESCISVTKKKEKEYKRQITCNQSNCNKLWIITGNCECHGEVQQMCSDHLIVCRIEDCEEIVCSQNWTKKCKHHRSCDAPKWLNEDCGDELECNICKNVQCTNHNLHFDLAKVNKKYPIVCNRHYDRCNMCNKYSQTDCFNKCGQYCCLNLCCEGLELENSIEGYCWKCRDLCSRCGKFYPSNYFHTILKTRVGDCCYSQIKTEISYILYLSKLYNLPKDIKILLVKYFL